MEGCLLLCTHLCPELHSQAFRQSCLSQLNQSDNTHADHSHITFAVSWALSDNESEHLSCMSAYTHKCMWISKKTADVLVEPVWLEYCVFPPNTEPHLTCLLCERKLAFTEMNQYGSSWRKEKETTTKNESPNEHLGTAETMTATKLWGGGLVSSERVQLITWLWCT